MNGRERILSDEWKHGDKALWRRPGERRWKKGTVRLVHNDAHGSVSLWDKQGRHVAVPNRSDCIRPRGK